MSEANTKPKKIAPKAPARKAAPEKPKAQKENPKKPDGPTRADFDALDREVQALREALRDKRVTVQAQAAELVQVRTELSLLEAGVDPKWSDGALLQAFSQAKVGEGAAGAMLVLLEREINQCHEDAEAREQSGDRAGVPGYVQAAGRLKLLRRKVLQLWTEAHEPAQPEGGQRASRFED